LVSSAATDRATTSLEPPGAKGTTSRMLFCGHAPWACTVWTPPAANSASDWQTRRRETGAGRVVAAGGRLFMRVSS
jgi:hypothetical protein